jgi:site-specific recombinase XerD
LLLYGLWVDVEALTKEHIYKGLDGSKWVSKARGKTNQRESVPLLPIAEEIIKKYQDDPYCIIKGKLLPVNSNQKYNAYLKEIADICGIKINLTTHTARHTFATTITLENDVPLETVSKMLGHKSIKTTQIYAKITQRKVSNNMQILRSKLFNDDGNIKNI